MTSSIDQLPSIAQTVSSEMVALVRLDLNVPRDPKGEITDDTRIRAALPTLELLQEKARRLVIMSHLGRPKSEAFDAQYSLHKVAEYVAGLLGQPVKLTSLGDAPLRDADFDGILMLENVRFNPGEGVNDPELGARYAALCDVFVFDAFATAHRAQASTAAVSQQAAHSCAGLLVTQEYEAITRVLNGSQRPSLAVLGGAKVGDKLPLLQHMATKVDAVAVGGGIANTFLAAQGHDIGNSLADKDLIGACQQLLQEHRIIIPSSHKVQGEDGSVTTLATADLDKIGSGRILDADPAGLTELQTAVDSAQTILWNGAYGLFEQPPFDAGTRAVSRFIADTGGYSIAGGGDTIAALRMEDVSERIDYISTAGGAFLKLASDQPLPAIDALIRQ